jgi:hypothetical protein
MRRLVRRTILHVRRSSRVPRRGSDGLQRATYSPCAIVLSDGVYLNPAVDVSHYRFAHFIGNCAEPHAVIFCSTEPNMVLITIQDHATGAIRCITCYSEASGSSCLYARQHSILDYDRIVFGAVPNGTHVALAEFSIGTCGRTIWLAGDAYVHIQSAHTSSTGAVVAPASFSHFIFTT